MRDNAELKNQIVSENAWKKSSRSGGGSGGDCVEVAKLAGGRAIRDSKNKGGGDLRLTEDRMAAFLQGVKAGAFDL
ncbi:DUF397 domain-containing protein [Streptomyces sp. NBC_00055]|uniref:DUF397 domain-containing protein n=1 Tax=Streptomyces sp. NBC_00055 TaxID=2975632 RepID=UPI0032473D19